MHSDMVKPGNNEIFSKDKPKKIPKFWIPLLIGVTIVWLVFLSYG